jgi:plasmid stabilization system protein ParE
MDFKVIFRETFLVDLERIVRSIAAHNPAAAAATAELILARAESLSCFPERYPAVRQRPGIRRYVVKHYKIFYRVREAIHIVEVLRCWDGRRGSDPPLPVT